MIKLSDFSNSPLTRAQIIGLIITLILLITIPIGIYLSQKTQIFKPRAQESTQNQCGGPFFVNTYCINEIPRGLIVTWSNIPGKYTNAQGKIECNVFIKDNQTTKDYSISKDCTGFAQVNVLHDLDGNNPDAEIVPNRSYSLYVSDGDNVSNVCYNTPVVTVTAQCTTPPSPTPTPAPIDPYYQTEQFRKWVFAMRELGIYPEVENGEIVIYSREQWMDKHPCLTFNCIYPAPTKWDLILRAYGDKEFIRALMGKMIEGIDGKKYRPLRALMPYFESELKEIIPAEWLNNEDFIASGGIIFNIFNTGNFEDSISPDELKKFILATLKDKIPADELSAVETFIAMTNPFLFTKSFVNVLSLPPNKVTDNDRFNVLLSLGIGILGINQKIGQGLIRDYEAFAMNSQVLAKQGELVRTNINNKPLKLSSVKEEIGKGMREVLTAHENKLISITTSTLQKALPSKQFEVQAVEMRSVVYVDKQNPDLLYRVYVYSVQSQYDRTPDTLEKILDLRGFINKARQHKLFADNGLSPKLHKVIMPSLTEEEKRMLNDQSIGRNFSKLYFSKNEYLKNVVLPLDNTTSDTLITVFDNPRIESAVGLNVLANSPATRKAEQERVASTLERLGFSPSPLVEIETTKEGKIVITHPNKYIAVVDFESPPDNIRGLFAEALDESIKRGNTLKTAYSSQGSHLVDYSLKPLLKETTQYEKNIIRAINADIENRNAYVLNPATAKQIIGPYVNYLNELPIGIKIDRQRILNIADRNWIVVVESPGTIYQYTGFESHGYIGVAMGRIVILTRDAVERDLTGVLLHEITHAISADYMLSRFKYIGQRSFFHNAKYFSYSQEQSDTFGALMSLIYELYADESVVMFYPDKIRHYANTYPKIHQAIVELIDELNRACNCTLSKFDFMRFALTFDDQALMDMIFSKISVGEFMSIVYSKLDTKKLIEIAGSNYSLQKEVRDTLVRYRVLLSAASAVLPSSIFLSQTQELEKREIIDPQVVLFLNTLYQDVDLLKNQLLPSIFRIYINWNGTGGSQFYGVGAGNSARIEGTDVKDNLCNSRFVEKTIRVEYANGTFLTPEPKIRIVGSPTLCREISGGNQESNLFTPSNLTHQCLNNNTLARVSWSGNGQGYDIRVEGSGASYPKRDCPPHSVCVNNHSGNSIDINVSPNAVNSLWMTGVRTNSTGAREESQVARLDNFRCPNVTLKKPQVKLSSCNKTTLNLSWTKSEDDIPGKDIVYAMRGVNTDDSNYYPTLDGTINGIADPDYLKKLGENAKKLIGNNFGDDVSCLGSVCSYSRSGLDPTYKYRVWVSAVTLKDGKVNERSENSYFPTIVDCDYREAGSQADMVPYSLTASCQNNKLTFSWEATLQRGTIPGQTPTEYRYHVRGIQTDDPKYFPPDNWTDGVDSKRYVTSSGGTNVTCQYKTIDRSGKEYTISDINRLSNDQIVSLGLRGHAKCTYQDDQSIKRVGNYRLWVSSYIPGKNLPDNQSRTINSYMGGESGELVSCGN